MLIDNSHLINANETIFFQINKILSVSFSNTVDDSENLQIYQPNLPAS